MSYHGAFGNFHNMSGLSEPLAKTPTQFLFLAQRRLQEAVVLLKAREWAGSLYLAGYVVECAMKALVAKKKGGRLPAEYQTHDLVKLRNEVLMYVTDEHAVIMQSIPEWSHLLRYNCSRPPAAMVVKFIECAKEGLRCMQTYT
ncbi:HEPN domain-containing protein [Polyangium sp. 15x6]|uniref:HEPN domain-containing protein n=1 Tax=Polyangium sp. 15x6 TaxID=3042687 RepID=UPI0032B4B595